MQGAIRRTSINTVQASAGGSGTSKELSNSTNHSSFQAMPGLAPGIYILSQFPFLKTWMAGTSPPMTPTRLFVHGLRNAAMRL
jgi:hypothetical protein